METSNRRKSNVALLSILSNTLLIVMKIVAGILSGSVSIISEAIHSAIDLLAAIIAFVSVRISSRPADREHPYGHGKVENISGVLEGLLIFVAAALIIKAAIHKFSVGLQIDNTLAGIIVMIISAFVNILMSRKLYKVAKEEDSIALEADALHLKTDVYTSFGVAFGLILIYLTGITLLDPLFAIGVALLIMKESWFLVKNAFNPLIDSKLSDAEEKIICQVLENYNHKIIDFHELRTRKAGNIKYIDFHLTIDASFSFEDAHCLSDDIERDLEVALKNTSVNIHAEPGTVKKD